MDLAVFISHSRTDTEFVRELRKAFDSHGIIANGDWDLRPGPDYWIQLRRLLSDSHALIFVMSPDSILSQNAQREVNEAVSLRKLILPIRYRDGYDVAAVPEALSQPQWTPIPTIDAIPQSVLELIHALHTDFDLMEDHIWLTSRSEHWDSKPDDVDLLRGDALGRARDWLMKVQASPEKRPNATQLQEKYVLASLEHAELMVKQEELRRTKGIRVRYRLATAFLLLSALSLFSMIATQQARSGAAKDKVKLTKDVDALIAARSRVTKENEKIREEGLRLSKEVDRLSQTTVGLQTEKANLTGEVTSAKELAKSAKMAAEANMRLAKNLRLSNLLEQGRGWMVRNDWRKALPILNEVYEAGYKASSLDYLLGQAVAPSRSLRASLPSPRSVRSASYSANGQVLGLLDRKVKCYDTSTWALVSEIGCLPGDDPEERRTTDFFLSADGSRAVTLERYTDLTDPEVGTKQDYESLVLWNVRTGTRMATLADDEGVTFEGFREGRIILCRQSSLNSQTKLIDSKSGEVLWSIEGDLDLASFGGMKLAYIDDERLEILSIPSGVKSGSFSVTDVSDLEWNEELQAFVLIMNTEGPSGTLDAVYATPATGGVLQIIYEQSSSDEPNRLTEFMGYGRYVQYFSTGDMDLSRGLAPLVPSSKGCSLTHERDLVTVVGQDTAIVQYGAQEFQTQNMREEVGYRRDGRIAIEGKFLTGSPDGKSIVTQDIHGRVLVWKLLPSQIALAPQFTQENLQITGPVVRTASGVKTLGQDWDATISSGFSLRTQGRFIQIRVGDVIVDQIGTVGENWPMISVSPGGRYCAFESLYPGVSVFDSKLKQTRSVKSVFESLRLVGWTDNSNLIVHGTSVVDNITPIGMRTSGYWLANPWMSVTSEVELLTDSAYGRNTIPRSGDISATTSWFSFDNQIVGINNVNRCAEFYVKNAALSSNALCLSGNGQMFLSTAPGNAAVLRESGSGRIVAEFRSAHMPIKRASFVCKESLIVTERDGGMIEIWDSTTGTLLTELPGMGPIYVGPDDAWISKLNPPQYDLPSKFLLRAQKPSRYEVKATIKRLGLAFNR